MNIKAVTLLTALAACVCAMAVPLSKPRVVISEIMYHPVEEPAFNPDGTPVMDLYEDAHEFLELHNEGTDTVSLSGWRLAGGIEFTFPAGTEMQPGAWLVAAKNPLRLAAVTHYPLLASDLPGPWIGQLSNQGGTIKLQDATGHTVDSVAYSARFPWPISADGLGADDEWTGLKSVTHQYRGRSLERVCFTHAGDDPANWLASPLDIGPSPGRPNAVNLPEPKPVVIGLHVAQASNGLSLIRANQPVRIECIFSSTHRLSDVKLEYFVQDIQATHQLGTNVAMVAAGQPSEGRFMADLPGRNDRSLVRFRIRGNRGDGDAVVSPRPDDPMNWHAYFVTPARNSTNTIYDLFISARSLNTLRTNISQTPRRITRPDPPGTPRPSWNATEPAVFVQDGVVYDVRVRYHGSEFRRQPNRNSYKVQFPRYRLFNGRSSVFVTDKDYQTAAGHALFRDAGLPTSLTRWVDLYLNNNSRLVRLEQEEYDEDMLRRYHAEQSRLQTGMPVAEPGEIYKAQGIFEAANGPYGRGDGRPLPARGTNWTALQRYEWTYAPQDHGWRGHTAFKEMIDQLWVARGGKTTLTTNEYPALRAYYTNYWDIDKTLTYLSVINWMSAWDDTAHNYFLWRQRDGRWSMLPWDFDNTMNGQSATTSIITGAPFAGPNFFKESFIAAFRAEFKERLWWLNNTVLHPDNLAALKISASIQSWAKSRFSSVNTQCGLGGFRRPNKPLNLAPAHGQSAAMGAFLMASAYSYSTNPVVAHGTTTWLMRPANGNYYAPIFQTTSAGDLNSLSIPLAVLKSGETYFWQCIYTDANGHPSLPSVETSFTVNRPDRQTNEIVLNEILATGSRGNNPDWIELYNPRDQTQSLAGLSLTDNLMSPNKFVFPLALAIAPHGYLVVWCDKGIYPAGLHTGFGLSAEGETVALLRISTNGPVVKDLVTLGSQLPNLSVGRISDPTNHWTLTVPTPGAMNQSQPLGPPAQLRFNEWMANPDSGSDWFEIYNADALPVDLGGLYLTTDLGNPTQTSLSPLNFIDGGGYAVFMADVKAGPGAQGVNFKLAAHDLALGLYLANGAAIDTVMAGVQVPGVAQGRLPDGSPLTFSFPNLATPGRSNFVDHDLNGLPDAWEMHHHWVPGDISSGLDEDGDGLTNLQEYWSGTEPRQPQSHLKIEVSRPAEGGGSGPVIRFLAQPGKTYKVQYGDVLGAGYGTWHDLMDTPSQPFQRWVEATDSSAGEGSRFYRIIMPVLPQ